MKVEVDSTLDLLIPYSRNCLVPDSLDLEAMGRLVDAVVSGARSVRLIFSSNLAFRLRTSSEAKHANLKSGI